MLHFFSLRKELAELKQTIDDIDGKVANIWLFNCVLIASMAFLPYFLLGTRLAYTHHENLSPDELLKTAWRHWPMKFIVACVMILGWMYIVNPYGRGATTVQSYLTAERIVTANTLPIYIDAEDIAHTVAGFLGWYLHLLFYFFNKLYHNDVLGSRVYRFLFGKFLFTIGLALTFSSILENESKIALFLIGFFPLSAISIIKEYGLKATQGVNLKDASLSELPGISRWQILRLEEEGIDSISTLANYRRDTLNKRLPAVLKPFISLWVDVAQLYTIIGDERYAKVKPLCQTASEFVGRVDDDEFRGALGEREILNPAEIVRLLESTFGENLLSSGDGSGKSS